MKIDRGILAAMGAAVLFGLSTPLAKTLVADISPLLLAGLLYTGSGVGLAVLLGIRMLARRRTQISWPRGTDLLWLLAAALFGGAVAPYLLMRGLVETDSASSSLILNLEGVLTALLAWFVFKENFDRRIVLGMLLIVAGGAILSVRALAQPTGMAGPALIAAACLAWAIDNNLTRKASINDAMSIACTKGLIAGPVNVALALHFGAQTPGPSAIVEAGLLGFVGYGLSLTLFVLALRQLGTARTGAYFSLAPFMGAAFAVMLGAPVTTSLWVASSLMGLGVWLHLTERHAHVHRHEPSGHAHQHSHDAHHRHEHVGWLGEEPHSHFHVHEPLEHAHPHFPDVHHRHPH
jgi:drug/metabolite transporter (DMT)-like permease